MFPASCGKLPAIAVGFPQSCAVLPPFSGAFPQVAQDFRTPPEVSRKLWETSVDLRKGKTGVFVTSVHCI
ncbi:hypothetical protein EG350_02860 [Chryseobacterium shandongense]|nr:hypothetical protein EG350_02860 [Chryseobacterium shandongense]